MPTVQETIQKVNEFAALPMGWHFGDGMPPSQERIDQAVNFLEYANLSGFERANAFPGVRGQVEVTFYSGNRMLEITIESNGSITIAEDQDGDQVRFDENLSKFDAYHRLEEFNQDIWPSSDLYTVDTMTQNVSGAFPAVPWIAGAVSHFLPLMWIAHRRQAVQSALISKGIITSRPEFREFTGLYQMRIYRMPAGSNLHEAQLGMTVTGTSTIGGGSLFVRLLNE